MTVERFDCERCGVNVAYHQWPCIAEKIAIAEEARRLGQALREGKPKSFRQGVGST